MSSSPNHDWFEAAWSDREEVIYPRLFGPSSNEIFTISQKILTDTFKQESFDPRWLHYGVIEFPPTPTRPSWLYVTSGMSNAWEDSEPQPEGPSGFGCEFVFETIEQGNWAILRLQHLMIFQILIAHGKYPGRELLGPYDRVPLRGSITPESSELSWLILAPPVSFESRFQLTTGWVELYQAFGASEAETAFAREAGGDKLVELLARSGAFPITDPRRKSVVPVN